eukprot:TRINITY_DN2355_c0_g1_i1.p1 TRINITY_DN2355_c0_g1~~TRINITY_DN2355_c0_g1_i1.p1  ORF type:complete len:596 (-),score=82.24 TRINITY_DN2355_c0_g1_i1:211-1998(-)
MTVLAVFVISLVLSKSFADDSCASGEEECLQDTSALMQTRRTRLKTYPKWACGACTSGCVAVPGADAVNGATDEYCKDCAGVTEANGKWTWPCNVEDACMCSGPVSPTPSPTDGPVTAPTAPPTDAPVTNPTAPPTDAPVTNPTASPTGLEPEPTGEPTAQPGGCTPTETGIASGATVENCAQCPDYQWWPCHQSPPLCACGPTSPPTSSPTPPPSPVPPSASPTPAPPTPPTNSPSPAPPGTEGRVRKILNAMNNIAPEYQSLVTTDAQKMRHMVDRVGTGAHSVTDDTWLQYIDSIEKVAETTYPDFLNGPDEDNNKRELCAFLNIINWETDFTTFEETLCKSGSAGKKCDYIDYTVPYTEGQQYYGRGPKQLSWNYNYEAFSKSYFNDSRLLDHPELVLSDYNVFWGSSMWFWMSEGKAADTNYGGFCPPQGDGGQTWPCQATCTAWLSGGPDNGCNCEEAKKSGHWIVPGKLSPHNAIHSGQDDKEKLLGVVSIVNGGYDCCPISSYGPVSNTRGHTVDRARGYSMCIDLYGLADKGRIHFQGDDICPNVNPQNDKTCPDCSCFDCYDDTKNNPGAVWSNPWKCELKDCAN